jgi:heme-degrading monooxygenase HmoA
VTAGSVAVIFTSVRTEDDGAGYAAMAHRMVELAAQQDGFISIDSVRDQVSGLGITVSYWRDDASAAAWKHVAEHLDAQHLGRELWYRSYEVVVASVERSYRFSPSASDAGAP